MEKRGRAQILHAAWMEERGGLVEKLKQEIGQGWDIDVFLAIDGRHYQNKADLAKRHPWTGDPVTPGTIGCTLSHVEMLRKSVLEARPHPLFILEDDCIPVLPYAQWEMFIMTADLFTKKEWDILLLGATEYVESSVASFSARRVERFWGTHAVIVKPRAAEAILRTFVETQKEGVFMPADWLYNEAIRRHGLRCYGPADPHCLCKQATGLVSSNAGEIRG